MPAMFLPILFMLLRSAWNEVLSSPVDLSSLAGIRNVLLLTVFTAVLVSIAGYLVVLGLWCLFGKDVITIKGGDLLLKRKILAFGIQKKYRIPEISPIRYELAPIIRRRYYDDFRTGFLAFDHGTKIVKFGYGLPVEEVEYILGKFAEHFPKPIE